MNKKLLPKSVWDFYHFFPSLWNTENTWDYDESQAMGLSISEDDNHVFIEAPLPGVPSENIELSFENGQLSIEGNKKEQEEGRKYHKKTTFSFYYCTRIPGYIDEEKEPEATYQDGVLNLRFFKDRKKRKKIPIRKVSSVAKSITG